MLVGTRYAHHKNAGHIGWFHPFAEQILHQTGQYFLAEFVHGHLLNGVGTDDKCSALFIFQSAHQFCALLQLLKERFAHQHTIVHGIAGDGFQPRFQRLESSPVFGQYIIF